MNDKTLISVQCYQGDVVRTLGHFTYYMHHEAPVIIISPEDSPVIIPGLTCRQAHGRSGYIGQESLDRQRSALRILLEYPFDWYLLNDSDSFCVSPEIPRYLYDDPAIMWSNEVVDPRTHPTSLPRLALQAPYFLSRQILERLVAVCDKVQTHPITPYIDHFMLQLAFAAGVRHIHFRGNEMCHPVKTIADATEWRKDYER